MEAIERRDEGVTLGNVLRFHGAKSTVRRLKPKDCDLPEYVRSPDYGEWSTGIVKCSFSPLPKRSSISDSGFMPLRSMEGLESQPYDKAILSEEALAEIAAKASAIEQPDADFLEIE